MAASNDGRQRASTRDRQIIAHQENAPLAWKEERAPAAVCRTAARLLRSGSLAVRLCRTALRACVYGERGVASAKTLLYRGSIAFWTGKAAKERKTISRGNLARQRRGRKRQRQSAATWASAAASGTDISWRSSRLAIAVGA